jgi:hypothetical protein
MTKHITLNPRPEAFANERNDCAVRAMTLATGRPYAEVHALLAKYGRKTRRGTPFSSMDSALTELGLPKLTRCETDYQLVGGGYFGRRSWRDTSRPTLARFAAEHRRGRYIVVIRGHAFALVDGMQLDMAPNGARCRVTHYVRVGD